MGCKGKALPRKAKRPPGRPPEDTRMLSLFQRNGPGRCPVASARHRPPERVAAARIGRIAAGNTAPAEAAGTHLAAHVAVAAAVRHPIPHAAGALRRVGPTIPRIGKPSPRLPRRHAGSRVGDRRLCAQAAAVPSAAHWRQSKTRRRSLKPGLPQSLMPRCCTTSARSPSICTSNCPTARCGTLARPAAPAIPLPLPRRSGISAPQRRDRFTLPSTARP